MTDVLLPVALLMSILLVSILTLVVAVRNLRSSRRSEALGEDRYELLHDQHDRLEFLREERQILAEELERRSQERQQLMGLLGKTPPQLVEVLKKEREQHLEAQERIENLKHERLRLEQELHQLNEQLERERSRSDYLLREESPQEGERKEVVEQHVKRSSGRTEGNPEATDAAKRKAEELGVDLSQVEGSGGDGRIRVRDVRNAATRETRENSD
jgi:pyruvate/2-oxoglutarate dehydrogenase complex dihydrolipoamide acyltransferase (E2) component